ncbi:MAG: efflux RND transporter permease subunit [Candidatus Sericytochromatia bacterium]
MLTEENQEPKEKNNSFNISEVAIKRPVSTIMLMLTLIILGVISYDKLDVEYYPNMAYPTVSISTDYTGASPEEIESIISKPLEDAVSGISGVNHIRSISTKGVSNVNIEFKLEKDIKDAANEVREKVALIRKRLPREIDDPIVARVDPDAAPIINYAVEAPIPLVELTDYVRNKIIIKLQQVDGIAQIDILGGQEREVQVQLDSDLLKKYGLTPSIISQKLIQENLNFPSGSIKTNTTEISLRTTSAFTTAEQIGNLKIKLNGGETILLNQLGKVVDGVKEIRSKSTLNGRNAVVMAIQKQSGTNEVKISEELKKTIAKMSKTLPEGMKISTTFDASKFIVESKDAAMEELIVGAILAVLVIFAFLKTIRGTLISAIAIPTSVISTYACMYAFGFSLNTMTLLALALVVGILVDDAVVDLENIVRYIQLGEKPYDAAIKASAEIGLAVVATTFSIVAVFVPIGFMKGTTGQLFKEFGITVSCSVLVSLLVARTLTPTLSAYLMKPMKHEEEKNSGLFFEIASFYKNALAWSLKHRLAIVFLTLSVFFISLPVANMLPKTFIPKSDRDEFNIAIKMPPASKLDETEKIAQTIYQRLKDDKSIKYILTTSGTNRGRTDQGTVGIILKSYAEGRKESIFDIQKRFRKIINTIPGCVLSFREVKVINDNTSNYDINLSLQGDDLKLLQKTANTILAKLRSMPIVSDTNTSNGTPEPEIDIKVDRAKASALGISSSAIAEALRIATFGDVPTKIRLPNDDIDIRVRLLDSNRFDLNKIENLGVGSTTGEAIPLSAIAKIEYVTGPSIITRFDRQRQIVVLANAIPGASMSDILEPVKQEIEAMNLPKTIQATFRGDAEKKNEAFDALLPALITAIIFIYLILASQFEHFTHPFTIMTALPLSFVGAFLSLFLANEELGMMSAIGIVMLMGLVTKNSILLVDYTITLRKSGLDRNEAILKAGPVRLRPILMTTIAMIAGMLPVALRLTPGSEARAPMAIAVIGGLTTSTILTLVVIPVFYTLMDDFVKWFSRKN